MKKTSVVLTCLFLIFGYSSSAFIESLTKCGINDNECQRKLYEVNLQRIGKNGIPELHIPPIDPMQIKNVTVTVLNIVNITMIDGVAKGAKNCVFNKFYGDIEKGIGNQEIICDITIKGKFSLEGNSPLLHSVLGGSTLHGEGTGKVQIEKLVIDFTFPYYAKKRDDGEIYITCDFKELTYKYDILGKVTFAADNIYLGEENVSEMVVNYLNENWKYIMKSFGKLFIDKALEFYFKFAGNFYDLVPAKYYISDDLTPYLKN